MGRLTVLCLLPVLLGLSGLGVALAQPVEAPPRPAPLRQVFLIQNSGWMEPFYTPENFPEFKRRLAAFITSVADQGDGGAAQPRIIITSFNKERRSDGRPTVPGRTSPFVFGRGDGRPAMVQDALENLDLPAASDGAIGFNGQPRLPDSDFEEAIRGARELLGNDMGVIWLVTNNLPAPNGGDRDVDVSRYNQRLHDAISTDGNTFVGVQLNPVTWEVRGRRYTVPLPGFMVYGFAVDARSPESRNSAQSPDEYLTDRVALADNALGGKFGRLKPVVRQPMRLVVDEINAARSIPSRWNPDDRTLILTDIKRGDQLNITLKARVTILSYPWKAAGTLSGYWQESADNGCSRPEAMIQATVTIPGIELSENGKTPIGKVELGADLPMEIHLTGPAEIPLEAKFGYGQIECAGRFVARFDAPKLEQDDEFKNRVGSFYFRTNVNASAIPDIYLPPQQPGDSQVTLLVGLRYDPAGGGEWWIPAMVAAGLIAAAAVAAWGGYRSSGKNFPVRVGNRVVNVKLRRNEGRMVLEPGSEGTARVTVKRGWLGGISVKELPSRPKQDLRNT